MSSSLLTSIFALLLTTMALSATAQDNNPLLLAGSQWSSASSYSYAGAIIPVAGSVLGQGWFVPIFVNYLTYNYASAFNNQPVTAGVTAPGASAGIGYQWRGSHGSLSLSGSIGYQHFQTIPSVNNAINSDQLAVIPQIQGQYQFTPTVDGDWISTYYFGPNSNWNRFRLGWQPNWRLHVGIEQIFQGGSNYRIHQGGMFVSTPLPHGLNLECDFGKLYSIGLPTQPYVGLSVVKKM